MLVDALKKHVCRNRVQLTPSGVFPCLIWSISRFISPLPEARRVSATTVQSASASRARMQRVAPPSMQFRITSLVEFGPGSFSMYTISLFPGIETPFLVALKYVSHASAARNLTFATCEPGSGSLSSSTFPPHTFIALAYRHYTNPFRAPSYQSLKLMIAHRTRNTFKYASPGCRNTLAFLLLRPSLQASHGILGKWQCEPKVLL